MENWAGMTQEIEQRIVAYIQKQTPSATKISLTFASSTGDSHRIGRSTRGGKNHPTAHLVRALEARDVLPRVSDR